MEHGEDFEHDIAIVVESVTGILEILHKTQNPIQALEILSATTAYVLCNGISSAKDSDECKEIFISTLNRAISKAEELGATMWTRGTSH